MAGAPGTAAASRLPVDFAKDSRLSSTLTYGGVTRTGRTSTNSTRRERSHCHEETHAVAANLDEFPLANLLALFPEGRYKFIGTTVGGSRLSSTATLTHAVPDGPSVSAEVNGDTIVIRWEPVTGPPAGFPQRNIQIVAYQILVDPFQITLPGTSTEVTLPREFVQSLSRGEHAFEVLAIEAGGNQTITEGTFVTE